MKNIKQTGFIPFMIMLLIALILLKNFVGISFWLFLFIIIFFGAIQFIWPSAKVIYKSKAVAILLGSLFLVTLGLSFWQTNFRRSFSKIETSKALIDQRVAKKMGDKTKAAAVDIWEDKKDTARATFLVYYNELLAKGKTEQAIDTLEKFNKKWDMDFLKEQNKSCNKEKSENVAPVNPVISPIASPLILEKGRYVFNLKAGEETPWFGFPEGKITDWDISSPSYDYEKIVSDGTSYPGSPNHNSLLKEHCYYKLKANSNQFITVVVKNSKLASN